MPFYHPLIGLVVPKVTVTLIDSNTGQPLGDRASRAPSSTYTDIKKGKDGKMVMVRHKGKGGSSAGGVANGVVLEEVKKDGKNHTDQKGEKNDDDTEKAWTSKEDAKLKQLKADNKTWAQIAEEMGRAKHELQGRFREIKNKDSGDQKNDESGNDSQDGRKKKDEGKDNKFTADEDRKIRELLATNTSFKNIAKELGRNLDPLCKDHIAKLRAEVDPKKIESKEKKDDKADKNGETSKDNAGSGKKGKEEKRSSDGKEKMKNKPLPKNDNRKPASRAGSYRSHQSEARFTMQEWMTLQEDDLFSFRELQLLSEIIMKDSNQSWLCVASKFMDKTGRRVHPDDIADKFYELAAMHR